MASSKIPDKLCTVCQAELLIIRMTDSGTFVVCAAAGIDHFAEILPEAASPDRSQQNIGCSGNSTPVSS